MIRLSIKERWGFVALAMFQVSLVWLSWADVARPDQDETYEVLMEVPRSRWDADEPRGARAQRMRETSQAIEFAVEAVEHPDGPAAMRSLLLAVAWEECKFSKYVHEGCKDIPKGAPDCDERKAWHLWQSHAADRSGGTQGAAVRAAKHLVACMHHCDGDSVLDRVSRSVACYATGQSCTWRGSASRVRAFRSFWWRLEGQR